MPPPRLLHFRVSHYNEKVRWALDHKSWPHEREALCPGFHVPRVRRLTGQNKVPVLILDGNAIAGSSRILEELETRRPDPPIFPADDAGRKRALSLQAWLDEEVAPDLRRLFWSCYVPDAALTTRMNTDGFGGGTRTLFRLMYPVFRAAFRRNMGLDANRVELARSRLGGYFDRLESEIGPSGYLVGDRFGVADLTAAAVMSAIIRPPEFPYPLPEPQPAALTALRESLSGHPAFRWVRDIYARHRGVSSEIR